MSCTVVAAKDEDVRSATAPTCGRRGGLTYGLPPLFKGDRETVRRPQIPPPLRGSAFEHLHPHPDPLPQGRGSYRTASGGGFSCLG
jgi:hypothetical protein